MIRATFLGKKNFRKHLFIPYLIPEYRFASESNLDIGFLPHETDPTIFLNTIRVFKLAQYVGVEPEIEAVYIEEGRKYSRCFVCGKIGHIERNRKFHPNMPRIHRALYGPLYN